MKEELIVYPDKTGILARCVPALVVGTAAIVIFYFLARGTPLVFLLILLFVLVGVAVSWPLSLLLSQTPALVINEKGIFDGASIVSVGMVRWEEIANVSVQRVLFARFFGITPKDREAVLSRCSRGKRIRARILLWRHGYERTFKTAPILIPVGWLRITIEELTAEVDKYSG